MLDIFGSIGRILPGYVKGQRNAIKDNWQDLANYNNVQAGQLANAFTEATFGHNVDMFQDARDNSRLQAEQNAANFSIFQRMFPYMYAAGIEQAMAMPYLQQLDNVAKIGLYQQGMADPRMLSAAILGGFGGFGNVNNPPSAMR